MVRRPGPSAGAPLRQVRRAVVRPGGLPRAAPRTGVRRAVGLVLLALLAVLSSATPASAASWGWPLDGTPAVTRPFAPGPTPYSPGHRGVDLAARPGAAVRAAGTGIVAYAGLLAGRGVVVVVHGALRTTYEPVDAQVRVGQLVLRGQPLGELRAGHRGCPARACLHWGLRRGADYLDPLRLVGAGRVRLLPRGPSAAAVATGAPAAAAAAAEPAPGLTAASATSPGAVADPAPEPSTPAHRTTVALTLTSGLVAAGGLARVAVRRRGPP